MTTAFQSNAFQNNAFQIDTTPAVTGADSWPGDTYKKHKQAFIGRGSEEYDEILNEITARFRGIPGPGEEEVADVIEAVAESVDKKPVSSRETRRAEILERTSAELTARLKFQAEVEARAKAEMMARLLEEDDEEVILLI